MNRRSFLSSMLLAGAGSMILPGSMFGPRKWKRLGDLWIVEQLHGSLPCQLYEVKELLSGYSAYCSSLYPIEPHIAIKAAKWAKENFNRIPSIIIPGRDPRARL